MYPQYIDSDFLAAGVLDTIKTKYWSFIPRRGSGRTDPPAPIRPELVPAAIARARDGRPLGAEELTAMFSETREEAIEDMRQAADELREELAGRRSRLSSTGTSTCPMFALVGCAFCGFGQGKRSPDAYEHSREEFVARHRGRAGVRRNRAVHPVGYSPGLDARGLPGLAAPGQGHRGGVGL